MLFLSDCFPIFEGGICCFSNRAVTMLHTVHQAINNLIGLTVFITDSIVFRICPRLVILLSQVSKPVRNNIFRFWNDFLKMRRRSGIMVINGHCFHKTSVSFGKSSLSVILFDFPFFASGIGLFLSHEVGQYLWVFRMAQPVLFSKGQAFQQPCHILADVIHGHQSFFILGNLLWLLAVYMVPVGGGYHRHRANCKILINNIKRCCCTGSPCAQHRGGGFIGKGISSGVKRPIHKTQESSAGMGEIYGRAKDKTIRGSCLFHKFVYNIMKNTTSCFLTFSAGNTIRQSFITNKKLFGFNIFFLQSSFYFR